MNLRRLLVLMLTTLALLVGGLAGASPASAASTSSCGKVFVFLRSPGPLGVGHVGWGFGDCVGTGYYYGAIENPGGSPFVWPGDDNGFWQHTGSVGTMMGDMRLGAPGRNAPYTHWKHAKIPASQAKFWDALSKAWSRGRAGYSVVGNNCADATRAVLEAYGVPNLPGLQNYIRPDFWFGLLLPSTGVNWSRELPLS